MTYPRIANTARPVEDWPETMDSALAAEMARNAREARIRDRIRRTSADMAREPEETAEDVRQMLRTTLLSVALGLLLWAIILWTANKLVMGAL